MQGSWLLPLLVIRRCYFAQGTGRSRRLSSKAGDSELASSGRPLDLAGATGR